MERIDPTPVLEVVAAIPADRLPLSRMLELYQHDLSDIWNQDLDVHGEYGYELDRFWQGNAWPYVFRVDGRLAGFALVDRCVRFEGDDFWMDQFFVLKGFRRRGVGAAAAITVFDRHGGRWEVGQMPGNVNARAFWRRVIGAYTGGAFIEETLDVGGGWQGTVQRFSALGAQPTER